jgi:hypothetical protein
LDFLPTKYKTKPNNKLNSFKVLRERERERERERCLAAIKALAAASQLFSLNLRNKTTF